MHQSISDTSFDVAKYKNLVVKRRHNYFDIPHYLL